MEDCDGSGEVVSVIFVRISDGFGDGAEGVRPVLACIVETVSEHDRKLLDELERLIKEKKRELRHKTE